MSDNDGFIGNVPPAKGAGAYTNPTAPNAQVPTSTAARLLDTARNTNGAGMVAYNALLMYPAGTVGRAILDAGLGTTPWGNITGSIFAQTDLINYVAGQFTIVNNALLAHEADHGNPHLVDKIQVGLANVANLAPADLPVSDATALVISNLSSSVNASLNTKLDKVSPTVTSGALTLAAGTTITPSIKYQLGVITTVPVNHANEWDGTNLWQTNAAGVRKQIALLDAGTNVLPVANGGTGVTSIAALTSAMSINTQPTFRNLLVNGDIFINQIVQASTSTSNLYQADAWSMVNSATARLTGSQSTSAPPAGFTHSLLASVTTAGSPSAGDLHLFKQSIEGVMFKHMSWGTASASSLVVSGLFRSSLPGTYALSVRNGGANRSYATPLVINSANTWEFKTFVIPGDTTGTWPIDTSAAVTVSVCMAAGSTSLTGTANAWQAGNFVGLTGQTQLTATAAATFQMTGVQAERGVITSPFENVPFDVAVLRAQRYWLSSYSYGNAPGSTTDAFSAYTGIAADANTAVVTAPFVTAMRVAPLIEQVYNQFTGAAGAIRSNSSGANSFVTAAPTPGPKGILYITSTGGLVSGVSYGFHFTANARI